MSDVPQPKARRRGPSRSRSTGRLAAVQALYQLDVTDGTLDAVIDDFLQQRFLETVDGVSYENADPDHFQTVVRGVAQVPEEIDDMISAVLSEGWTVPRLEPLLRAVLRAGTFELAYVLDVPARVVIAEYMAVAHAFFSEREPPMVNGVLDAIARALRPEDLDGDRPPRTPADPEE